MINTVPLGNNFPIILEYSRIFPNICEYFWLFFNTLEYFATFWNILEYSEIKWNNNYLEYSIISWRILEYSKIFQNIPIGKLFSAGTVLGYCVHYMMALLNWCSLRKSLVWESTTIWYPTYVLVPPILSSLVWCISTSAWGLMGLVPRSHADQQVRGKNSLFQNGVPTARTRDSHILYISSQRIQNKAHWFHSLVHALAMYQVFHYILSLYTGWPRKNATTLIVNFKNIVDETE